MGETHPLKYEPPLDVLDDLEHHMFLLPAGSRDGYLKLCHPDSDVELYCISKRSRFFQEPFASTKEEAEAIFLGWLEKRREEAGPTVQAAPPTTPPPPPFAKTEAEAIERLRKLGHPSPPLTTRPSNGSIDEPGGITPSSSPSSNPKTNTLYFSSSQPERVITREAEPLITLTNKRKCGALAPTSSDRPPAPDRRFGDGAEVADTDNDDDGDDDDDGDSNNNKPQRKRPKTTEDPSVSAATPVSETTVERTDSAVGGETSTPKSVGETSDADPVEGGEVGPGVADCTDGAFEVPPTRSHRREEENPETIEPSLRQGITTGPQPPPCSASVESDGFEDPTSLAVCRSDLDAEGPTGDERELHVQFCVALQAAERRLEHSTTRRAMAALRRRDPRFHRTFSRCLAIARKTAGEEVLREWKRFEGRDEGIPEPLLLPNPRTDSPDPEDPEVEVVTAARTEFLEIVRAKTKDWEAHLLYRRAAVRLTGRYEAYVEMQRGGSVRLTTVRADRKMLQRALFHRMHPGRLPSDFTDEQARECGCDSDWNRFQRAIKDGRRWRLLVDDLGFGALLLIDTSENANYIQQQIPTPVFIAWVRLISLLRPDIRGIAEGMNVRCEALIVNGGDQPPTGRGVGPKDNSGPILTEGEDWIGEVDEMD